MNGKLLGIVRLKVSGLCVRLAPQIQLSGEGPKVLNF